MLDKDKYGKFNDIKIGLSLTRPALVVSIVENMSKSAVPKPFVKFTFSDGFSDVTAIMFNCSIESLSKDNITSNSVVDVILMAGEYQGARSFKVVDIAPCSDPRIVPEDFTRLPPISLDKMYDEIWALIRDNGGEEHDGIKPISDLTLRILGEKRNKYMLSSAAIRMHHNILGGLIYHSYRMVKMAIAASNVYDILDKELMICGAALHDIGKLWEYDTSVSGIASMTKMGVLYGHLYIGAEYIRNFAEKQGCYDKERVDMLAHMIASHHGQQDWGAVTLPAIPEAMALHFIDNMDSRVYMFEEAYAVLQPGELSTEKHKGLNTTIYKPSYFKDAKSD